MKNNIIVLILMLMLIFLPFINAAAVQVSTATGMQIDYPKYDIIKNGSDHRFHLHVINSTATKTNLTTSCLLHVYNQTGWDLDIGSQFMEFEAYNGVDFAKTVSGGNFSKVGIYSYVVQCNSSNEVAFASGQLLVTNSGYELAGDNFTAIIYILFIFAVSGLMYTFLLGLAKLATGETTVYDVIISWAFYILLIIVNYLGTQYLIRTFVQDLSSTFLTLTVWTNGVLPVISFIISIFIRSTKKRKLLAIQEIAGRRLS